MGTLYIDRKDLFLKLEGNAISIYYNGKKEGSIPLNPVKRIIVSSNIIFETRLIKRLVDNNITVIFLSGKNMRFCGILRGRLHNNGLLRVQQYKSYLDEEFRINFSKELILRKLQRHKELLEEWQYLNHQSISLAIKTIEEITKSLNSFTYSIDYQALSFFKSSERDKLIIKSGPRWEITNIGMRNIINRFENKSESLQWLIDEIIDEVFELIRELRT
jgi:CRISPR-associated protein Cas1